MSTKHRRIPEDWKDANGSVFPSDLYGYTAVDAALALHDHWAICDPPLSAAERLVDIDNVIWVLQRWREQQAAAAAESEGER